MIRVDYLIVGAGIAGLFSAIKLSQYNADKKVLIVTKDKPEESSSYLAQGGISIVPYNDRELLRSHINDTFRVGDYQGNKKTIKMVCTEAPFLLRDLLDLNIEFDKNSNGEFDFHKEGGHSQPRILHHKDITGKYLMDQFIRYLRRKNNVVLLDNISCIGLLTKDNECFGIHAHRKGKGKCFEIHASSTIMASGGIGQIFKFSTNPIVSTGDGLVLAHEAGAKVRDLEFVQFHPTSIHSQKMGGHQVSIVTEAIRGRGGVLKNQRGEAFMKKYHADSDLAPRDVVSRAIISEMKIHKVDNVFLDCRSLDKSVFEDSFPQVLHLCYSYGINPSNDLIPVVPAAHYSCGGIEVNLDGETSIKRLFACGECAYTGMHGANRLASNSLLEALVFAKNCSKTISAIYKRRIVHPSLKQSDRLNYWHHPEVKKLKNKVQEIMSEYFFVQCTTNGLRKGKDSLAVLSNQMALLKAVLKPSIDLIELRNLVVISNLILDSALNRDSNHGCFFNSDIETNSSI